VTETQNAVLQANETFLQTHEKLRDVQRLTRSATDSLSGQQAVHRMVARQAQRYQRFQQSFQSYAVKKHSAWQTYMLIFDFVRDLLKKRVQNVANKLIGELLNVMKRRNPDYETNGLDELGFLEFKKELPLEMQQQSQEFTWQSVDKNGDGRVVMSELFEMAKKLRYDTDDQ